jgi:polyhydroxyalkanoate synthase subunit PhaC
MSENSKATPLDSAFRLADAALDAADDLIDALAEVAASAAANAFDLTVGSGIADVTPLARAVIDREPQRTVYRYLHSSDHKRSAPVLLVPPLAAPARCFDLRRGSSVAEHMLDLGHPTYLVDYGSISFSDRQLGLEHWADEVIPKAIESVAADAGGEPVQVVGWCLGGIMSLLAVAGRQELPVRSVVLVASPFDFEQVRLAAPIRRLAQLTGGAFGTALYRALGGAPAPFVSLGFRLTAIERYLRKPVFVLRNLHDRETLAQMEAVDEYMANMLAYPGRTFGQLYHQFFRVNDLADGHIELGGREIDLADVTHPVLSIAGKSDVLAPVAAVYALGDLLSGSPDVRLRTAPGGHLGVLAGRNAVRTTWAHVDEFLSDYEPAPAR